MRNSQVLKEMPLNLVDYARVLQAQGYRVLTARSAEVAGTGRYLPGNVRDNSFFMDGQPWYNIGLDGTKSNPKVFQNEWEVLKASGVLERRVLDEDKDAVYMAFMAAKDALDDARMKPEELKGVIVASISNPNRYPSMAAKITEMLGARNVNYAVDLAGACAGSCFAVGHAADRIMYNEQGPYLIVGLEHLTKQADYVERDINSNLFSDGAGAMILKPGSDLEKGVQGLATSADPHDNKLNYILHDGRNMCRMAFGKYVFIHASKTMADLAQKAADAAGWHLDDVIFDPHQANLWIIHKAGDVAGVPLEKTLINVHKYGNMSSATWLIALDEARKEGINTNQWAYLRHLNKLKNMNAIGIHPEYRERPPMTLEEMDLVLSGTALKNDQIALDYRDLLKVGTGQQPRLIKVKEGSKVLGDAFGSGLVAGAVPIQF